MMAADRNALTTLIPFSAVKVFTLYKTFDKIAPNMVTRVVRKKTIFAYGALRQLINKFIDQSTNASTLKGP